MKKNFENPKIKIIVLESEDVVLDASFGMDGNGVIFNWRDYTGTED